MPQKAKGKVYAISIGAQKGKPKSRVDQAYLREEHGVDCDCHAGPGSRHVSLLAWEDILPLHEKGTMAQPGDFAENITTEGLKLSEIPIGTKLRIGDALLQISEIGKADWKEGDYSLKGLALVARFGLFARVIRSGWICIGDRIIVE